MTNRAFHEHFFGSSLFPLRTIGAAWKEASVPLELYGHYMISLSSCSSDTAASVCCRHCIKSCSGGIFRSIPEAGNELLLSNLGLHANSAAQFEPDACLQRGRIRYSCRCHTSQRAACTSTLPWTEKHVMNNSSFSVYTLKCLLSGK